MHVFDASSKAFVYHGFSNGYPLSNVAIQYKNNVVRRDTFTTGGYKAVYRFTVTGDFDRSDMQAAVERPYKS